jgi:hypothetical protein
MNTDVSLVVKIVDTLDMMIVDRIVVRIVVIIAVRTVVVIVVRIVDRIVGKIVVMLGIMRDIIMIVEQNAKTSVTLDTTFSVVVGTSIIILIIIPKIIHF